MSQDYLKNKPGFNQRNHIIGQGDWEREQRLGHIADESLDSNE
jgi:hypothetical protein